MGEQRLSLKQMCARFNVTPRTLRYYEYLELLDPIREGRSRFYGAREVARLTLILRGRRFGFPLEDIRKWLALYQKAGTAEQYRIFLKFADKRLAELRAEQENLARTLSDLKALRDETAGLLAAQPSPAAPASRPRPVSDPQEQSSHT